MHTLSQRAVVLVLLCSAVSGAWSFSVRDAVHHVHLQGKLSSSIQDAQSSSRSSRSSSISSGGASDTEVLTLPGLQHGLPSKHFAGYITVDGVSNRQLYYYLVTHESSSDESSPDDVPLIIWLTGGPGCSSLDAFTYEHGPFIFTAPDSEAAGRQPTLSDIQLNPNPHSWSKTAHVLYIDSPAGTGFSYTPGEASYHTSDDKTIEDLEAFVKGFFKEHQWLQRQPLYIAGESYGGVYVPLLTRALVRHNQRLQSQQTKNGASHAASEVTYNMAGYVVGNAVTDDFYDGVGQVEFAYGLGLIDPLTYHRVKQICKTNGWHVGHNTPCARALDEMEDTMGPVNHYDILGRCYKPADNQMKHDTTTAAAGPAARTATRSANNRVDYSLLRASRKLQQAQGAAKGAAAAAAGMLRKVQQLRHAVSCADRRYASIYYNSPEVRQALHAAGEDETGRWEPCSDVLHYTHTVGSMIPVHRELLDAGVRALVLSGDHDYVVPYTGTRGWVYGMNLQEAKPWHSWSLPGDDQVAGYAVKFAAGLTFASVKGGGHMVPQTHPAAALSLLQQWMAEEL